MTPQDSARFAELITDVLAFYGQTPSKFALSVWWQACLPFDYATLQRALGRHAMDPERGMFAPKPADIVRQIQGTPTDRATAAWSLALDAASRVGAYTDVAFDDPIIHAVIDDLGGWPCFCRTEAGRLSYLQHRFIEAFGAYARRDDLTIWPKKLAGDRSPDAIYLQRGLPPPKPVLIGDAAKALRVISMGSADGKRITNVVDLALSELEAITDQGGERVA